MALYLIPSDTDDTVSWIGHILSFEIVKHTWVPHGWHLHCQNPESGMRRTQQQQTTHHIQNECMASCVQLGCRNGFGEAISLVQLACVQEDTNIGMVWQNPQHSPDQSVFPETQYGMVIATQPIH